MMFCVTVIVCAVLIYCAVMQVTDLIREDYETKLAEEFANGYEWGKMAERANVVHVDAVLIDE